MSSEEFEIVEDCNVSNSNRKTNPYMSIYEYTVLISKWASHISNTGEGSGYLEEGKDPVLIAKEDVDNHRATLIIRRKLPDGTTEDWRPDEMYFPRK